MSLSLAEIILLSGDKKCYFADTYVYIWNHVGIIFSSKIEEKNCREDCL